MITNMKFFYSLLIIVFIILLFFFFFPYKFEFEKNRGMPGNNISENFLAESFFSNASIKQIDSISAESNLRFTIRNASGGYSVKLLEEKND